MNSLLAQKPAEPYYPGFRDMNLWFAFICLIVLAYVIAVASIWQRVRLAKAKIREIDEYLLGSSITADQRSKLEGDRDASTKDLEQLTAAGPGRWFR